MIEESVRHEAEKVEGRREPKRCAGCGELGGSISAGTGKPLVRDRATGGFFHVLCRPGRDGTAVALAALERMGG